MITGDGSEEDVATNEEIGTNEEIATNEESRSPKKKMTKSEYLKRQMEVKLDKIEIFTLTWNPAHHFL